MRYNLSFIEEILRYMQKKYNVLDLFSGVGGFSIGFENAGFNIALAIDLDKDCEKTHNRNFAHIPFIQEDIRNIKSIKDKLNVDIDVIIGGPPCQGFSTIGSRISSCPTKRGKHDPRNDLFTDYIRLLKEVKPKIFLMENVKGLLTKDNGQILERIVQEFHNTGYSFNYVILNAANYGVPQIRNRVFFYGTRLDLDIKSLVPLATHIGDEAYEKVGTHIMDLVGKEYNFPNHMPLKHNEINLRRYSYIPEGGRLPEKDLPTDLYRKNFGNTFKRLHREKPSLTMVPGHNAFPIHPTENRSLTVREAARIQTFPDNIIFEGSRQKQCMQVGNAVPPKLSEAWGKQIMKILAEYEK